MGRRVGKRTDLQIGGVRQWPPQLLPPAVGDDQAVAVMDGRAPIVEPAGILGAELIHAGQGGNPGLGDVCTGIQHGFDVEDRRLGSRGAGPDGEAVGAGGAGTVEQSVDDDGVDARLRCFEPECREPGELFAARVAGADREAPGGQAVDLVTAHGAEVAGAEEYRDLVIRIRPVHRRTQAQAGVANRVRYTERRVGIVEIVGAVRHRRRLSGGYDKNVDPGAIEGGAGKELGRERQVLPGPQATIGLEPDAAILVVRHAVDGGRELRVRRREGLAGQGGGGAADRPGVERARRLWCWLGRSRTGDGVGRSSEEEGAAVHDGVRHGKRVVNRGWPVTQMASVCGMAPADTCRAPAPRS